jgi:hypothetical protein
VSRLIFKIAGGGTLFISVGDVRVGPYPAGISTHLCGVVQSKGLGRLSSFFKVSQVPQL